jgi:hypothetical protein
LSKGMVALEKNIPNGKLDALGIATKNAAGEVLPLNTILAETADKFAGMPNGIEKTNLASDIFGKRIGSQLIPLLNKGSAGLAEATAKAKELGLVFSSDDLKIRADNVAAMREFKAQTDGLFVSLGRELVPAMTSVTRVATAVPVPLKAAGIAALAGSVAFVKLAASESRAAVGASKLIPVAALVGAAYLSLRGDIAKGISNSVSTTSAEELAKNMDGVVSRLQKADKATGGLDAVARRGLDGLLNLGRNTRTPIVELDRLDVSLAKLVSSGHGDKARAEFDKIALAAHKAGISNKEVAKWFDDYFNALDKGTPDIDGAAAAQKAEAAATREATVGIKAATQAVKDGTATRQQAMLVNRQRLATMSEEIDKSMALHSATRTLADSVKAYAENEATAAGQGPVIAAMRAQAADQAKQDSLDIISTQRAEQEAARGVTAANEGLDEAFHSRSEALRGVASAQRELSTDQANAIRLTHDLATAYADAKESLYQLTQAGKGDKIGVREAQLALEDAKRAAASGPTSFDDPNAREKLNLAVERAQLQVEAAKHNAAANQVELNKAQKAGVDGAPQVVSAQQAIKDNTLATAEAHHSLSEAERGVHAADRQIRDSAYAVVSARQASRDAARDEASAVSKASEDQRDAAKEISDTVQAAKDKSGELRDAVETNFGAAATAASKFGLNLSGIQTYLANIATQVAPGSPLAVDLLRLLGSIGAAIPSGAVPGFEANYGTGGVTHRAFGGRVEKGMPYLVGDSHGLANAEVLYPDTGGYITQLGGKAEQKNVTTNHITVNAQHLNAKQILDEAMYRQMSEVR